MLDSLVKEGEKKVLLYLANNGPAAGYTIFDDEELRRASVYVHLRQLAKMGLIEWEHETASRGFLPKKVYSLTLGGLAYVFTILPMGQETWRPIIERWASLLPLVFRKWQMFVKVEREKEALERLFLASELFISDLSVDTRLLLKPVSAESFLEYFYGLSEKYVFLALEEEFHGFLGRLCANDVEIRDYVMQYLDHALSDLSKKQELVRDLKEHF